MRLTQVNGELFRRMISVSGIPGECLDRVTQLAEMLSASKGDCGYCRCLISTANALKVVLAPLKDT